MVRRPAVPVDEVGVHPAASRPRLDQDLDQGQVAGSDGKMESRSSRSSFECIHVSIVPAQELKILKVAAHGGQMDQMFALAVSLIDDINWGWYGLCIRIGWSFLNGDRPQDGLGALDVSPAGGQMEGGVALVVPGIETCAGNDKSP